MSDKPLPSHGRKRITADATFHERFRDLWQDLGSQDHGRFESRPPEGVRENADAKIARRAVELAIHRVDAPVYRGGHRHGFRAVPLYDPDLPLAA